MKDRVKTLPFFDPVGFAGLASRPLFYGKRETELAIVSNLERFYCNRDRRRASKKRVDIVPEYQGIHISTLELDPVVRKFCTSIELQNE